MKRNIALIVLALGLICAVAQASQNLQKSKRYRTCENKAGAGFFWVDTTCGKVWWLSPGDLRWIYWGKPKGAKVAPSGTYIPHENKSGGGLFILNTTTGEGWWTNGNEWKVLGKPIGNESKGER